MTTYKEELMADIEDFRAKIIEETDPDFLEDYEAELNVIEDLMEMNVVNDGELKLELEEARDRLRERRKTLTDQLQSEGDYYVICADEGNWDNSFENLEDLMQFIATEAEESVYVIPPNARFEDKYLIAIDNA